MSLPNADYVTTERLLNDPDRVTVSSEILSAIAAFLIAGVGPEEAAEIFRSWADEIEKMEVSAPPTRQ